MATERDTSFMKRMKDKQLLSRSTCDSVCSRMPTKVSERRKIMPFNWSVRNVSDYSEISCATAYKGHREYPVFTVKDSSGFVIEEVQLSSIGDAQWGPLPNTRSKQELGLYLSRINTWIAHNVTQSIVWMTIPVGLNVIKESNINEWMRRIEVIKDSGYDSYVKFHDLQFNEDELKFEEQIEREVTREDLERRIGLSTNASSYNKREFNALMEKKRAELVS